MDDFLKQSVSFAKKTLREQGELHMMIVGLTSEGEKVPILGIFRDEEEKSIFLRMCSFTFMVSGVQRYIAFSEAWMSTRTPEEMESKNYVPPSQDKKRKECLVVADVSYDKESLGLIYEIERGKDKKISDLKKMQTMKGITGRITELLPPRTVTLPKELEPAVAQFVKHYRINFH